MTNRTGDLGGLADALYLLAAAAVTCAVIALGRTRRVRRRDEKSRGTHVIVCMIKHRMADGCTTACLPGAAGKLGVRLGNKGVGNAQRF